LEEAQAKADESDSGFPDERLKLLFVCAHPAIDVASRAPLMLHCVLGVDPGRIASAFLVSPVSMRQRLVRAKARIKAVGIRFDVPESLDWPERLDTVMDAIYAAYGTGWDGVAGADSRRKDLTGEAVWLGRALVELLPGEAEPRGLLSLMLHCEARARARRSPCGDYVPLDSQDTSLWDRALITEANAMLCTAPPTPTLGRFCCEAAIQAVHAERSATGVTNWQALVVLYDALARICPALGVLVSRAVCVAELEGARRGLTLLDELDRAAIARYQPYWAVRAHLAAAAGDDEAAAAAYEIAIGLSEDDSVRRFLIARARRAEELRPDMDRQRTPS
jgi:RNA polymerase sigma-70 factor (ECF subfamily)